MLPPQQIPPHGNCSSSPFPGPSGQQVGLVSSLIFLVTHTRNTSSEWSLWMKVLHLLPVLVGFISQLPGYTSSFTEKLGPHSWYSLLSNSSRHSWGLLLLFRRSTTFSFILREMPLLCSDPGPLHKLCPLPEMFFPGFLHGYLFSFGQRNGFPWWPHQRNTLSFILWHCLCLFFPKTCLCWWLHILLL